MRRKTALLVGSFLMALSLLLASCAPAAPAPTAPIPAAPAPAAPTPAAPTPTIPAPTGPEMVKVTFTKLDGTKVEKSLEKPRYGGWINIITDSSRISWDPTQQRQYYGAAWETNDQLFKRDHMRGPAGTGETEWLYSFDVAALLAPEIATSYELQDDETIILHIRQGVHYDNKPPVNGREVTAADVVHSIKYSFNMDPQYPAPKSKYLATMTPEQYPISVTATDKWTVVVKVPPIGLGANLGHILTSQIIYAPEITPKAGESWTRDRQISNGPWILTDNVPNTSYTFVRNLNYWKHDYAFLENQLPYADGYKGILIRDRSTLLAAFRTGKTDMLREISRQDTESILSANPNLKVAWKLGETRALYYRVDKPELPWYKKEVRQAMQMAIDREAIKKDLHSGQAAIFAWPIQDRPELRTLGAFMPMEELPANVQELFQYNPEKAKQMLAQAGYPDGFTMKVLTQPDFVDELSVLQFYLAKIGIKLIVDVREVTTFESIVMSFKHEEGVFERLRMSPDVQGYSLLPGAQRNYSMVDDPVIAETHREFGTYYMVKDDMKAFAALRKAVPHTLEQAWLIAMPTPMEAMVWWPWLKRFDGINQMGGQYGWTSFAWVDQELKKSMGY